MTIIIIVIVVVVVVVVVVVLLFIIYTINLYMVQPRSCRVIYYFDTPALWRRHQSFGHVIHTDGQPSVDISQRANLITQNATITDFVTNEFTDTHTDGLTSVTIS